MEEKLFAIVSRVLKIKPDEVNWQLNKSQCEKWDSLAHISLVIEIEDAFNCPIPFEKVNSIESIADLKEFLKC